MTAVARTGDRTVFEIVKVDHKADDARSSARRHDVDAPIVVDEEVVEPEDDRGVALHSPDHELVVLQRKTVLRK